MKILVLASASVLALATPAFAQDDRAGYNDVSYIEQIGSNNKAVAYQNGGTQGSTIEQLGSNDEALNELNGSNNTSVVLQQASAFVGGHNLSENRMVGSNDQNGVVQSGARNTAYTTFDQASSGTSSLITQDGADNAVDYTSIGTNNFSLISQTFDQNGATVVQAGANNVSYLAQDGLANNAGVSQTGMSAFSYVGQTGNGNVATVTQN